MDRELVKKLEEHPSSEEVRQNPDGTLFMPIGIVEGLLDQYFDSWDTTFFSVEYNEINKKWIADASVTLICYYKGVKITRKGAATREIAGSEINKHYSATLLSLATVNAAQKLGNRFGRALNGRVDEEIINAVPKKKIPDIIIIQQRKNLIEQIECSLSGKRKNKNWKEQLADLQAELHILERDYDFKD